MGTQFYTQLYALAFALVAFAICLSIDYRTLSNHSLLIYAGLVGVLVYALLFGVEAGGARRWISLGPFNLQPSEFAKIGLALVVGTFFAENRRGARTIGDLLMGGAFVAVPVALIAREPDLGTAVAILMVYFGIMYFAGLRMRVLAWLAVLAILAAPVAWTYALEDYQRSRLSTLSRSCAGRAGRRLSADPGAHHRGIGWAHGQGILARDTGAVQVPAGGAQRFHLLGG